MPSTLLATKLHRPPPTANLIVRPRLVQRLDAGLANGHRLFLVVAPAGYGKTTLVTDWLGRAGISSAWLVLDEADNDPRRFFTYVVAALRSLGLDPGQSLLDEYPGMPQSPEALVSPLINDLAAAGRPLLLVLDDYHRVTAPSIQEAMAFWLDHAPANLHLAVLTRADPPFPLPRLRVSGLMTEIRDHDLRFTPEEMTAFLNTVHRLNLPPDQIAALESRTEGWPAGVQLAALSLQGCDAERAGRFISAFSGSHHYVIDYLADEVLLRQTEEVQSFLLRTSILDRLTGSLCDAVLGGPNDSDRMLVELGRKNLFLIPLDDERRWYRYHHLFSELLFERLKQTQPEIVGELNARAAAWHEQHGYLENAVDYALKAQDHEAAIRLMERTRNSLWNRGEVRRLLIWLDSLPEELIRSQPDLTIFRAGCLTLIGCFDLASQLLQLAEDNLNPTTTSAGLAATVPDALRMQRILAYRSASARYHGDYAAAIALGQGSLDRTPAADVRNRGVALLFLSHAHFYSGDTVSAEQVLGEAVQANLASGHHASYLNAVHHLAQLRVLQGRLGEARVIYEQAIQFAGEQATPVHAGTEHAGLGDLQREWNQLQAAAAEIEKGLRLAEASDFIFFLTDTYLARVRLALSQRDWEAASSFLRRAERVVRRCPTSVELELLQAWQARLQLAQGNLAQAGAWAEAWAAAHIDETWAAAHIAESGLCGPQQEFELLTLARVWLAQGNTDRAASLLERIRTIAEASGRYGRALEAHMLQALAHQAAANEERAVEELVQVLAQAQSQGCVRLFLDEGAAMAKLLHKVSTRTATPVRSYVARLLADYTREQAEQPAPLAKTSGGDTPSDKPSAALVEPLSERELEVLRLMAAGSSNKQIAGELVITIGTVKRHTANIFDKLDVHNRSEAVAIARRQGLL